MNSQTATDFIVVDDEPMSNRICEIVITRIFPESDVYTFTNPEKAFAHITNTYSHPQAHNAILFLDIAMPIVSGWQILEKIGDLPDEVKNRINVYMLSSSTDQKDINKASRNPLIKRFIEKPLLINSLRQQLSNADF